MNALFSRLGLLAVLLALFLPATASGQTGVWIDGVNRGASFNNTTNTTIAEADVYSGGTLNNSAGTSTATASIGIVNLSGGVVNNGGHINILNWTDFTFSGGTYSEYSGTHGGSAGTIGTLNYSIGYTLTDSNFIYRVAGGTDRIETFNVNLYNWWGQFHNLSGSTINNATVTNNGHLGNAGTINNVTISGGSVDNIGRIEELTFISGGQIGGGGGNIGTLNVVGNLGGTSNNVTSLNIQQSGILGNFTLKNGTTINNGGLIDNLTYAGGTYNRTHGDSTGIIRLLCVTDNVNASGINWGSVTTANVNSGGTVANHSGNTIGSAEVFMGGHITNLTGSIINETDIFLGGSIQNFSGGMINTARMGSGATVSNAGAIADLTYRDGNYSGIGTIGILNVDGDSTNVNWGSLATVNVNNGGTLQNRNGDTIASATANRGGNLINLSGGTISNARLAGGSVTNEGAINEMTYTGGSYTRSGDGAIGTLNVAGNAAGTNWGNLLAANLNSGTLENKSGNVIVDATISGGSLTNESAVFFGSRIVNATVDGGTLNNNGGAFIDSGNGQITNATMKSGTVNNGGQIDRLNYFGGTYNGVHQGNTGTIGTLTVAGDLYASNDWGIVNNLVFDSNGSGILHISASADDGTSNFRFTGIEVTNSIDLTNGRISLDMSNLGTYDSYADWNIAFFGEHSNDVFSFANLFGTDNVTNWDALDYFELAYGNGTQTIFNGNQWMTGWAITNGGIEGAPIPEPATLAIIGLGLAGLGWARRRQR